MAKATGQKNRPTKKPLATKTPEKRIYFRQADFPLVNLQQAQKIASAIVDNFAGASASPPDIALALSISPTSSSWQTLTGAAIAYGLTDGGYNADKIVLSPLGRKLVAPEEEGQDLIARRQAILKPRIMKEFFEKYNRAKLPNDIIALNVLKAFGIPPERAEQAFKIIKENGAYSGVIRQTPTGPFVSLDSPGIPAPVATPAISTADLDAELPAQELGATGAMAPSIELQKPTPVLDPKSNRVFITHGKQKAIVTQIKDLLIFGNFEPVVSVERESTAIPVPEKVFEDMRSCSAGVIHVGSEGKYLDKDGNEHRKINDNVLIEIGAAIALFGKRVVLLVERDVQLPSNLQGLYRCEFGGDALDHESTMKLLKTFTQFR